MKRVLVVVGLAMSLCVGKSSGQEQVTRIALINTNIPSGAILKEFNERCKNIVLTTDVSKANFLLEAQINKESENRNERSWLTVFDHSGDAIFTTDTHGTGNAVKDVCGFLKLSKS